jgi:hypothetical protein
MPIPREPRPHVLLPNSLTSSSDFRSTSSGRSASVPSRVARSQAYALQRDLRAVEAEMQFVMARQQGVDLGDGAGISVRFSSFPGVGLAIDSFELKSQGIELLNVRLLPDDTTVASVWIPDGKLEFFESRILKYLESASNGDTATKHRAQIDAIQEIRSAVLEDIWTDESPMPPPESISRFEAWISTPRETPARGSRQVRPEPTDRVVRFRRIAAAEGLTVGLHSIQFPERAVLHVTGTIQQMRNSIHLLGQLAELRLAPETAEFFMRQKPDEQREWTQDLLRRTSFTSDALAPHICILDTGCVATHPLLSSALHAQDMYSINASWGVIDEHGHGTQQAGVAIWGDLADALASQTNLAIAHRLEAVKLLRDDNSNLTEHLAPLTAQAVSLPEIAFPFRSRVFSMAVTCTNTTIRGKPSAWSAEVDALTSDWIGNGESRRLFVISGGNVFHSRTGGYLALNSTTSIEDPAQAWNALSVGALTHKIEILESGTEMYVPLAASGELSPFSSTSSTWHADRPFKPDIVFEGGNMGDDGTLVSEFDSMRLLTTHQRPNVSHYSTTFATSAATALASQFAARIMAAYPSYWPETARAIMIHSANWTPGLLRQFPANDPRELINRLRHCGWGEPDIGSALYSGADSLTLVYQGDLQPFRRAPRVRNERGVTNGGHVVAGEMHMHRLPWPAEALQALMNSPVELRVTLSYFIEPNPGERGRGNRFSYASHGLRFAVQSPTESRSAFERRINLLAREGMDDDNEGAEERGWMLGMRKRFRGSVHHDRLSCQAVDMASRGYVAVFPVSGWWKTREAQERVNRRARYSLVVSLRVPELSTDVDLYTELLQRLRTLVPVEVIT